MSRQPIVLLTRDGIEQRYVARVAGRSVSGDPAHRGDGAEGRQTRCAAASVARRAGEIRRKGRAHALSPHERRWRHPSARPRPGPRRTEHRRAALRAGVRGRDRQRSGRGRTPAPTAPGPGAGLRDRGGAVAGLRGRRLPDAQPPHRPEPLLPRFRLASVGIGGRPPRPHRGDRARVHAGHRRRAASSRRAPWRSGPGASVHDVFARQMLEGGPLYARCAAAELDAPMDRTAQDLTLGREYRWVEMGLGAELAARRRLRRLRA